jgi:hypothetical protein
MRFVRALIGLCVVCGVGCGEPESNLGVTSSAAPSTSACASKECELIRIVNGIDGSCYRFQCDAVGNQWVEVKPKNWPCAVRSSPTSDDWNTGRCDDVGVCQVSLTPKN